MSASAESDGSAGGKKRLGLDHYAAVYAANLRTVKRWRAHGRKLQDPAPLENPEAMLAWWTRCMKQSAPAGISAAVIAWRKEGKGTPVVVVPKPDELLLVAAVAEPEKTVERAEVLDRPVTEDEIGLEQTLRRLAENEVRLSRMALDPGQAKPWLDTIARMSSAAKSLREESERKGKLIPKAKAEAAIQEFHGPIKSEFYLMDATMSQILGLPLSEAMQEAWRGECDRLFARFKEEVFQ